MIGDKKQDRYLYGNHSSIIIMFSKKHEKNSLYDIQWVIGVKHVIHRIFKGVGDDESSLMKPDALWRENGGAHDIDLE